MKFTTYGLPGVYNSTPFVLGDGQGSALAVDINGRVILSSSGGGFTVDTELTTADFDTGAGTDVRAVVGLVGSGSGGGSIIPGDATNGLFVQVKGDALTALSDVNTNLNQIEGYVDQLEGYVDQLEGYTDQLEGYTDQLEGFVDGIEGSLTSNTISTLNSTTTPLGVGGVFTGTAEDVSAYAGVTVMAISNVASAANGLTVQFSPDGTNWDSVESHSVAAGLVHVTNSLVAAKFFRIVYTNGGTIQASFRVQTIFKVRVGNRMESLDGDISDSHIAQTVRGILSGKDFVSGAYVNISSLATGTGANVLGVLPVDTAGNTLEILATQADNVANTVNGLFTSSLLYAFDGTTFDRLRGDATDGLLVNLGTNNDVTVTGSVTANAGTNLNTSALALESGGNLAGAATSLAIIDDWDNGASDGASVSGDVAHDSPDAGEPVKIGGKALDVGAAPTAVTANDRVNAMFLRNGVQIVLGGSTGIVSQNLTVTDADGAQTDTAIVTVSAGTAIIVTAIEVTADNANTGDVGVRVGFGTANTPAQDAAGVILNHTGIAPGSGVVKGNGAGIIGIGASNEDLRVTCEDPVGGAVSITVTYHTILIG